VIQFSGSCARHRSALVDFVDHAEIGPATGSALAHLDRCGSCTAELEAIVQTITALRRLGDEAGRMEPAPDAWPRLRERLTRWRPRSWRIMTPLAGTAMSLALVAVVVVPLRFGASLGSGVSNPDGLSPAQSVVRATSINAAERRTESAYIATVRRMSPTFAGASSAGGPGAAFIRVYPDDIRPTRKEVGPAATTIRPSEAS
jgi:anti-sigma factor RsiW